MIRWPFLRYVRPMMPTEISMTIDYSSSLLPMMWCIDLAVRSNDPQMDLRHFIRRLLAPRNALRRVARVTRVAGRIVVGEFHVDASSLRQPERHRIPILLL